MGAFLQMLTLQLSLFLLIIVGVFAKRNSIISETGKKNISNLLINIILPCNIINSFSGNISNEIIKNSVLAVIISFIIQLSSIIIGKPLFKKFKDNKKPVLNYGLICSNSSFIGLPVVASIFGNTGVLYASIFQIPIRITMWTSGLALFTTSDKKKAYKDLLKHPCIIAVEIGFLIMVANISLPEFIGNTISTLSQCTVPISMLVVGCILAECNLLQIFDWSAIYFSFIRLIAFPALVFVILKILGVNDLIIGISILLTGMPAGSTTAILADKYGCDSGFASKVILVSTLLSIFTIPLMRIIF